MGLFPPLASPGERKLSVDVRNTETRWKKLRIESTQSKKLVERRSGAVRCPRYASGLMRPGEIPPAGLLADELVVDD
jgi:hypothetical protein